MMKKLILAAAALASLAVVDTTPASAFGCTTQWVDGKIAQVCDSGVAATLATRGRSYPRCRQETIPGTWSTRWVCY